MSSWCNMEGKNPQITFGGTPLNHVSYQGGHKQPRESRLLVHHFRHRYILPRCAASIKDWTSDREPKRPSLKSYKTSPSVLGGEFLLPLFIYNDLDLMISFIWQVNLKSWRIIRTTWLCWSGFRGFTDLVVFPHPHEGVSPTAPSRYSPPSQQHKPARWGNSPRSQMQGDGHQPHMVMVQKSHSQPLKGCMKPYK